MDLPQWVYTVGWALWLLWFAVLETLAVAADRDPGDTLSEHVWFLIFTSDGRTRPVVWFVFAGFLVWVIIHFLTRGRV